MKQILLSIFLSFGLNMLYAQFDSQKRNSIFAEVAGTGGLGSMNYERHFLKKNSTDFTWRVGLSFAPIDKNNGTGIVVPLMVNTLIGKNAHKLELGLGQGITMTTRGSFFALTTPAIGYRLQSAHRPWFYRVTYTPIISYLLDFQLQHWGGISVGYSFNN